MQIDVKQEERISLRVSQDRIVLRLPRTENPHSDSHARLAVVAKCGVSPAWTHRNANPIDGVLIKRELLVAVVQRGRAGPTQEEQLQSGGGVLRLVLLGRLLDLEEMEEALDELRLA